jgi:MarR family transcriptional regulator, organic hydroperoxide resistance regulator
MKEKELAEISSNILQLFPLFKALIKCEGAEAADTPFPYIKSNVYHILGVVKVNGPLPISVIGRRLFIAKQNMTTITDRLIQDGLLERQRDVNDRRIINIAITKKGIKLLQSGKQMYKEILRKNLSKLTEKDIDVLHESLGNIITILKKIK